MHWLLLLLAIGSEIVATSALKETQGFTRLLPSLLCIGGYALAFYLLSVVVKYVPVGIAYALWSGIGVVIVSLVGWFFFHQKLDLPAMIGLGLIVAFPFLRAVTTPKADTVTTLQSEERYFSFS